MLSSKQLSKLCNISITEVNEDINKFFEISRKRNRFIRKGKNLNQNYILDYYKVVQLISNNEKYLKALIKNADDGDLKKISNNIEITILIDELNKLSYLNSSKEIEGNYFISVKTISNIFKVDFEYIIHTLEDLIISRNDYKIDSINDDYLISREILLELIRENKTFIKKSNQILFDILKKEDLINRVITIITE